MSDTVRDRIAKRIREAHPTEMSHEDAAWLAGAVLDELGWNTAPRTVVKEDEFWIGDWPTEIGTYRLVREASE